MLEPGTRVDHYRVVELLGAGGMGQVYVARDEQLGRQVALKLISIDSLPSEELRQRFIYEARTTARFSHPHIVSIFGVGDYRGRPYMALEYLPGETLEQRIARGDALGDEAVSIGLSIASALHEAHAHGVLHRDLKPANVMLAADGRLRVLDFGLATAVAPTVSNETAIQWARRTSAQPFALTSAGMRGTPRYMAPEQWEELPCTPATDIWALGVMLLELLGGRHPYADVSSVYQLALRVCDPDPVPGIEALRERVDARLLDLAARCLAKPPEQRPTSGEVASSLRELDADAPGGSRSAEPAIVAAAPSTGHGGVRSRGPARWLVAAIGFPLAAALGAVTLHFATRDSGQPALIRGATGASVARGADAEPPVVPPARTTDGPSRGASDGAAQPAKLAAAPEKPLARRRRDRRRPRPRRRRPGRRPPRRPPREPPRLAATAPAPPKPPANEPAPPPRVRESPPPPRVRVDLPALRAYFDAGRCFQVIQIGSGVASVSKPSDAQCEAMQKVAICACRYRRVILARRLYAIMKRTSAHAPSGAKRRCGGFRPARRACRATGMSITKRENLFADMRFWMKKDNCFALRWNSARFLGYDKARPHELDLVRGALGTCACQRGAARAAKKLYGQIGDARQREQLRSSCAKKQISLP